LEPGYVEGRKKGHITGVVEAHRGFVGIGLGFFEWVVIPLNVVN
jgi:hypothetical protein